MPGKIKKAGWILFFVHIAWFLFFVFTSVQSEDFILKAAKKNLIILVPFLIGVGLVYFFFFRKVKWIHDLLAKVVNVFLWAYLLSMVWLLWCTFFNPPITLTQISNMGYGLKRDYVSRGNLGRNMKLAVIASEDQLFPDHDGFDIKAIKKAMKYNQRHPNRQRGASTLSQQTAKNIFLWQGGGFLRKGLEVFYTFTIESLWGKEKILARYLNIAEMGKGVFGAEAAAQQYFGKSAKELTAREAAMIAACLPNPKKFTVKPLSNYVNARANTIVRQMNAISTDPDVQAIIK